jgi:spermidine synthase
MMRLFVILAFFVSGASSLMLEVVWSKALGHVLGNTLEAITTVVAAYMGGLALGAGLAGRSGLGQRRPVLAYGLLEIGIGLFGIASLFLIAALDGPLGAAYAAFGGGSAAYTVVRFLVTFALLLVPTTMMGATLPILVTWGARRADLARVLGTLYAVNTAGAVAGTALAGFVFLPALGLSRTALLAGGISITLGVLMALVARNPASGDHVAAPAAAPGDAPTAPAPPVRPAKKAAVAADGPVPDAGRARIMLVLFACSGAVSLATQLAWTRVGAILLGSSVYSFTLVLATFLVGISAGAALIVPWISRHGASWRLFAVLQWIAAAGILYASVRIADAPWALLAHVVDMRGQVGALWIQESLLLAGFMLPACLAFGALFPIATRLAAFPGDTPSRTTGRSYGWNTFGTITGSLLTGFFLVHTIGMRGTLLLTAGVALALGVAAWFLAPVAARKPSSIPEGVPIARVSAPALAVALFVVGLFFAPPWDRGLLSLGVFRPLIATMAGNSLTPAAARQSVHEQMASEKLLSFVEGRQATVSVHLRERPTPVVAIRVNGKVDASTGLDMATQIVCGHLPMMWASDSARVAIVGFGSGVTVGSALTHPLGSLDLVEIEPAVLDADRWFREHNGNPLADPRVRVHVEDGRTFIARSPRPFDVIISEPSNPWLAGVNNLFTVDFYRLVRGKLAPGGVFCQWMQFYEMSGVTLASLVRSLHQVFPDAQVFLAGRDILFVATLDGRPLDLARVAERLQRPAVEADLERARVRGVADLVALHQGPLSGFVSRLPEAPLNLDDRPFVEYRAPIDFYTVSPMTLPFSEQAIRAVDPVADLSHWTTTDDPVGLAIEVARGLMGRADLVGASRWLDALVARDPSRAQELADALRESARRHDFDLRVEEARRALTANDVATARRLLDRLRTEDPGSATVMVERARIYMRTDSLAAARDLLETAFATGTDADRYDASVNLAIVAMRQNDPERGLALFERASTVRPQESGAWVYRARALAMAGRTNEARLVLDQARSQVTDRVAIETALQQLATTGTIP